MCGYQIPGPGSAMAIAAGVAAYAASQTDFKAISIALIVLAFIFGIFTLCIENLHKRGFLISWKKEQKSSLSLNENEIKLIKDFINYKKEKNSLSEEDIKLIKKFIKCVKEN